MSKIKVAFVRNLNAPINRHLLKLITIPLNVGLKILMQHETELKFMRMDSTWTTDIDSALDFYVTAGVIRYGVKTGQPFLIRFHFSDARLDFTLDYNQEGKRIPHLFAQSVQSTGAII